MHLGEVRNKFNILIINLHVMLLFSAEASHVLVSFFEENDQPTAIIPIKRVKHNFKSFRSKLNLILQ